MLDNLVYTAVMRQPRMLADAGKSGLYHVCSRVVDRRVIFGDRERRKFMHIIKGGAAFAGIELVSWCLMGNHFHLLVRVPPLDADTFSDEEVFSRMQHIYSPLRMRHLRGIWERMGSASARHTFLAPYRARMGSLSEFVKTLKQRFTQWFNCRNDREGTLWEGRFHSVMLSHNDGRNGDGLGVLARFVAGYIDLNPVRAGLARDADESDWSGFGAALRGDEEGAHGIRLLWGENATRDMTNDAVFAMHRDMLGKALFREQVETENGHSILKRSMKDSVTREISGKICNGLPENQSSEPPGAEKSALTARRELSLFRRMGERCEALIKGRCLGADWVHSQLG